MWNWPSWLRSRPSTWACPVMAPSSQITTATEDQACPFCLLAAVLAQVPPLLPRANGANFENGLLMSPHLLPGAGHSVFGLCYIPHSVPCVAGGIEKSLLKPWSLWYTWEPRAQGFWNCSLSQSLLRLGVGSDGHNACALYCLSPGLCMLYPCSWFTSSLAPQPMTDEKELYQWAGRNCWSLNAPESLA